MQLYSVTVTTNASGDDATDYTPRFTGRILEIRYSKTDYDANPDFTLTLDDSGRTVWEEDNVDASTARLPRQNNHQTDGTTNAAEWEPIYVMNDRVKILVENGGASKSGMFEVIVD
ncbi:MAG: hypothetical protein GWO40_21995 [Gammaproteobacteria bacterium]|nr:hypothetical protein [Gammaproteobacteria bacterium]NIV53839.1 hypothetical protein [Gammaproteobacteria bacterium]NIX88182.1 hypothetical protein [Gammaproteobacteria bacterium]